VHRRTGEQVSGTTRLCDPVRERTNLVFGKRSARLLKLFITGRLPSKSGGTAYRRLHRHLLRPVYSNVVINNVTATTTSANERYVRSTVVRLFIMFCEYMFSCYLFLFILLFSTSSMFDLHVVVVGFVMFNILELIMEIVPNYRTWLEWTDPTKIWVGYDPYGNPCSEEDMSIFYAATTITLGNGCKTPFWHADTAGRFVIWSECLRHFPASIF
jgi:hypothetical protein